MFVLIGTPIFAREWILPTWLGAIERQDYPLSDIGFSFEAAAGDNATIDCLFAWHHRHPEVRVFDVTINTQEKHVAHNENGHRRWRADRYQTMVGLRNSLLSRVRCYEPDRYFSLDSDIILENPATISTLVQYTSTYPAVSPLAFMTPEGTGFPSVMTWVGPPGGRAARGSYNLGSFFQADVIMAAKMMSKPLYQQVSYNWHPQGEDLGWSANAAQAGYKLYSASQIYCPHLMSRSALKAYLLHGDPRSEIIFNYNP